MGAWLCVEGREVRTMLRWGQEPAKEPWEEGT